MREEERLKGKANFRRVLAERKSWANKFFVLKASSNELPINRYGLVVSKRIGNAVVRNRVKRLLREVIRTLPDSKGYDVVLIARTPAADADFMTVNRAVEQLFSRAGLLEPQLSANNGANIT